MILMDKNVSSQISSAAKIQREGTSKIVAALEAYSKDNGGVCDSVIERYREIVSELDYIINETE